MRLSERILCDVVAVGGVCGVGGFGWTVVGALGVAADEPGGRRGIADVGVGGVAI